MIPPRSRIFVATAPIDLRVGFDRLAGAVRTELGDDPRSGAFFIFLNRRSDRVKVFFFDGTGDCILYKRLDRNTFRGIIDLDVKKPRVEIDVAALATFLAGVPSIKKTRLH